MLYCIVFYLINDVVIVVTIKIVPTVQSNSINYCPQQIIIYNHPKLVRHIKPIIYCIIM